MSKPRRLISTFLGAACVLLVLLCGITISWTEAQDDRRAQDARRGDVVSQRSSAIEVAVVAETRRYVDTLENLSAAVGAQSDLRYEDFMAITAGLRVEGLSGATSVSYVEAATDLGVQDLQRSWHERGVSDLTLEPVGSNIEHKFVLMSRTLDDKPGGNGRDLSAAIEPMTALDRARETGTVAASEAYILLKDRNLPRNQQQLSFIFAVPVYGAGTSIDSGEFRGWLVMGMHGQDFMNGTLRRVSQDLVNVTLADESTDGRLVPVAAYVGGEVLPHGVERRSRILVGGNEWALDMEPTTAILNNISTRQDETTFVTGTAITVLLILLVWVLMRSRRRALHKVERATEQLRADIARREEIEAELRTREAELSAFNSIVAHDLKSPLTSVLGYTELLQDEMESLGQPALAKYVERTHNAGKRMRALIDDLLSYATAKDAGLDIEAVDLQLLVSEIIGERSLDGIGDTESFEVGELPVLQADVVMMRQLLDNLIGNAIKYVRPGEAPRVSIAATRVETGWRIQVADRGIGVPEDQHEKVFTSFHRSTEATKNYSGTGLGLAICQRIVERHGGRIGLESNDGGGSRFWFVLPVDGVSTPQPGTHGEQAASTYTLVPSSAGH